MVGLEGGYNIIGPIGRVTLPLKGWERIGTLAWWDMNKGNYPS